MKRIYLSLLLALTIFVSSAYASPDPNKEIQESFKKEFPNTKALAWIEVGDFMRATFLLDGQRTEAYFSEDGILQGSVRYLFFSQLPLAVMKAVEKRYVDADPLDVYEITNDEGTSYRITLESQEKKYKIKVDANGNITQSDRLKK